MLSIALYCNEETSSNHLNLRYTQCSINQTKHQSYNQTVIQHYKLQANEPAEISTDLIEVDRHISCACSCVLLICLSIVPHLNQRLATTTLLYSLRMFSDFRPKYSLNFVIRCKYWSHQIDSGLPRDRNCSAKNHVQSRSCKDNTCSIFGVCNLFTQLATLVRSDNFIRAKQQQ